MGKTRKNKTVSDTVCEIHKFSGYAVLSNCFVRSTKLGCPAIFSSVEEMGEYGEHFSKVQKHILEVIPMARNSEKNVAGIVLNAFSESFILDAELFDMIENMKSRLE